MSTLPARIRRLIADYELLRQEFVGHPLITVDPLAGNPPERYRVTFRMRSIERLDLGGTPQYRDWHVAEIYLHDAYPRQKPLGTMQTPIFHPNFGQFICIGDYWGASETLADVIVQIGQMIAYQKYNPASPLNREAAQWARNHTQLLPTDKRDAYAAHPRIELSKGLSIASSCEAPPVQLTREECDDPPPVQLDPNSRGRQAPSRSDLDIRLT
jgi:ubiquitin-protein ligase